METQRLLLREMNPEDFEALFRVLRDPVIMQHYPYAFDEQCVRSWIERNMNRYRENGFGLWAVCLKNTGEMIGDCGLTLQNIASSFLCTGLRRKTYAGAATGIPAKQDEKRLKSLYASG